MQYEKEELLVALHESLKLQKHYAELLNMHDGGERLGFDGIDAWVERLRDVGVLKRPANQCKHGHVIGNNRTCTKCELEKTAGSTVHAPGCSCGFCRMGSTKF